MKKLLWTIRNFFNVNIELALCYLEISFVSMHGGDMGDVLLRLERLNERKKRLLELKEQFGKNKDLE